MQHIQKAKSRYYLLMDIRLNSHVIIKVLVTVMWFPYMPESIEYPIDKHGL